jgi:septal ring-binding cell division protein DamX
MLFVLGVIVGKRLESRGRAVSPEIEDPLALLDKVATSPRPAQAGVTFPQALFGSAGKNGANDKHGKKAVASLAATPEADPAKALALAAPVTKPEKSSAKSSAPPAADVEDAKNDAQKALAKPAGKPAEPVADVKPSPIKPTIQAIPTSAKPAPVAEAKPVAIPAVAATPEGKGKGHFALQLSSFQDKNEAEAFAQKFQGEKPYMVISEIPGKGIWYRVRVGDYATAKDASAAKQSFERKHSVIAYIAQR